MKKVETWVIKNKKEKNATQKQLLPKLSSNNSEEGRVKASKYRTVLHVISTNRLSIRFMLILLDLVYVAHSAYGLFIYTQ